MAVLDDILAGQQADENQSLALAAHDASWANFFNSTPPADKLRANLNLTNMVSDAVQKKQDLLAQTDKNAADLRYKNAQYNEFQKQAPLREQVLQARIDAEGATERRKAMESTMEAQQTANLNTGYLKLIQSGAKKGTPEYTGALAGLIADNPHAQVEHLKEFSKLADMPDDVDPVKYAQQGVDLFNAAKKTGFPNPVLSTQDGKWVIHQGPSVLSEQEKIDSAVNKKKALKELDTPKAVPRTPEEKVAAAQDAIVSGALHFGTLDEKGNLVPNSNQKPGPATHVSSSYLDPSTGKMVKTPAMSVDDFKKFQAQAEARKKGATPAQSEISTKEDFDALPSGAEFVWNGKRGRKP